VRGQACQFSFTCDGSTRRRREPAAWVEARRIAQEALAGAVYAPVGTATHYHTHAVRPGWGRRLAQVITVGTHIFYRGRGESSPDAAFVRRTSSPEGAGRAAPVVREAVAVRAAASVRIHRSRPSGFGPVAGVQIHRGPPPLPVPAPALPGATPVAAADTRQPFAGTAFVEPTLATPAGTATGGSLPSATR
jgi:hypothetical protein